jgi:hypothetical protein
MKICIYFKDIDSDVFFSNEDLKEGDEVFPIVESRLVNGEWYLTGLRLKDGMCSDEKQYCTGFPNDSHKIINLSYSDYRPYEVRTNHGYGPIESYFKVINIVKRERVEPIKPKQP